MIISTPRATAVAKLKIITCAIFVDSFTLQKYQDIRPSIQKGVQKGALIILLVGDNFLIGSENKFEQNLSQEISSVYN